MSGLGIEPKADGLRSLAFGWGVPGNSGDSRRAVTLTERSFMNRDVRFHLDRSNGRVSRLLTTSSTGRSWQLQQSKTSSPRRELLGSKNGSSASYGSVLSAVQALRWLTKKEWEAHPDSVTMGTAGDESITVTLTPALRPRPALASQATAIAEDLTVLLRREKKRW